MQGDGVMDGAFCHALRVPCTCSLSTLNSLSLPPLVCSFSFKNDDDDDDDVEDDVCNDNDDFVFSSH